MLSLYTNVSARLRLREEKGATAVEYGIMVALIAVVIIAAVALLGGYLNEAFQGINCQINTPDTPKWDAAAEACAA